jgi:hypothetical protein
VIVSDPATVLLVNVTAEPVPPVIFTLPEIELPAQVPPSPKVTWPVSPVIVGGAVAGANEDPFHDADREVGVVDLDAVIATVSKMCGVSGSRWTSRNST